MSLHCITFFTGVFFATIVMMIARKTQSIVLNMGPVNVRSKKRRKPVHKVDKEQITQLRGPIECKQKSPPTSTREPKPLAPPKPQPYDRCGVDNLPKHPVSDCCGFKSPPHPTAPPPPPPPPATTPPPPPPTPRLRVIQVPCKPPPLTEAKSSQCSCATEQFSGFSLKVIPSLKPSKPNLTPAPVYPCEGCDESKQEMRKRRVKETRHKGCCTEICPNDIIDDRANRRRLL